MQEHLQQRMEEQLKELDDSLQQAAEDTQVSPHLAGRNKIKEKLDCQQGQGGKEVG